MTAQDMVASWTARGVSPDPSTSVGHGIGEAVVGGKLQGKKWNRGPAFGKGANIDWFKVTVEDFAGEIVRIKGTKEYSGLTRSDRKAMDALLQRNELAYRAKALLHMQEQTKIHLSAELEANLASKRDAVAATTNNPAAGKRAIQIMFSTLQEKSRLETGATFKDAAVRAAAVKELDDVSKTIITNMMNSQDPLRASKARAWLNANQTIEVDSAIATGEDGKPIKISMTPNMRDDLNTLIDSGLKKEIGRAEGNRAWQTFGKDNRSFNKWLALQDDMTAETKKLVREQYTSRLGDEEAQVKRELTVKKADAVKLARAGKFDQIGDAVLAELGGTMSAALRKISAAAKRGAPIIDDPKIVNELNRMRPEQLQAVNLLDAKYLGGLSTEKWDHFSTRQASYLGAKAPAAKTAMRTRVQIVNQNLDAAGIDNETEVLNFNNRLDDAIKAIEEGNKDGAKATSAQIQNLADLLLIDGEYKGGWTGDPNLRVFQLKTGQVFFLDELSDIPPAELAELREIAKKFGITADDELLDLYNKDLRRRILEAGVGQ
jgi:hypothetical protein